MGKHWVYVLKYYDIDEEYNENTVALYIGETTRLYRRFNEHINGNGSKNTKCFRNYNDTIQLVGLYDVSNNLEFIEYNHVILVCHDEHSIMDFESLSKLWRWRVKNQSEYHDFLQVENCITEMCLTINKNNSIDVKGGKYTKEKSYKNITLPTYDRPLCKCGYPGEVFLSKKNEVWFKCAVANTKWLEYNDQRFTIAEPCNYIEKYMGDVELREKFRMYSNKLERIPKIWKIGSEGEWLQNKSCVICKRNKYSPMYSNGYRALCKICFNKRFSDIDMVVNNHKGVCMIQEDVDD